MSKKDLEYYYPSIEEIHIGYEGEMNWHLGYEKEYSPIKITLRDKENIYHDELSEVVIAMDDGYAGVRCKFLDEEDVVSLGWSIQSPHNYYVLIEKPINKYSKYEALLDKKNHTISINYINNDPGLEYPTDEYIFDGKCPTINELRYISKLLGI